MKVLISTDLYDYQINGVTISIITLRDELKKKGHDVRVLALSPNRKSMKKNNDYYLSSFRFPIYPGVRFSIAYRDKMLDEIVKWSPDIVHVQTEFSSYLLAKRIIRRIHTPVVHTCHTVYEEYVKYICPSKKLGKKIVKSITSRVLSRADGAIVPTKKLEGIVRNFETI